ncbi:MAG: hypothetical protein Q8R72_12570 [Hylemonella sp.]|nr:hypothetical protein [Hylemonella sp.]
MKNLLIALCLASACAAAQAEAPRWRVLGSVAYGSGGDTLVSETYSNTGQPFELRTGTGWVWTIGADLRITDKVAIQGSIGHQRNRAIGANFDFDFQRQPVELLAFYALTDQVRLGLGARKVQNAKLTGYGTAAGYTGTGNYDSTVGAVLEGQYFFTSPSLTERKLMVGMNLRYVQETFKLAEDGVGPKTDKRGDHVEIGVVFYY